MAKKLGKFTGKAESVQYYELLNSAATPHMLSNVQVSAKTRRLFLRSNGAPEFH
jgi:hypothetical protein